VHGGGRGFPAAHLFCDLSAWCLGMLVPGAGVPARVMGVVTVSGLVRPRGWVGRWRLRTGSSILVRGARLWAGAR
jgi:hypothetical protein